MGRDARRGGRSDRLRRAPAAAARPFPPDSPRAATVGRRTALSTTRTLRDLTTRILHVSPYFPPAIPYGGPPASILGLCQGLQRAGLDIEVVTTTANGKAELPASTSDDDRYDGV